jgi:hypothetical protein
LYRYNFWMDEASAENDDESDHGREGTVIDLAYVRTEATFLSTLTDCSLVQAILKKAVQSIDQFSLRVHVQHGYDQLRRWR